VFALLYGLGLRVGEVTRLKLPDADLTRDMLFIRETKFNKSRIVPMGPQLAQRVKRYVEIRYGSTAAPELGLRGAMEQRTDLSGSTKPSFCRTVCLTLAEATSGVIFGTNNWFVESKFSFLPSWRVT
jgi:integrase